jgi:hypothetical protein
MYIAAVVFAAMSDASRCCRGMLICCTFWLILLLFAVMADAFGCHRGMLMCHRFWLILVMAGAQIMK